MAGLSRREFLVATSALGGVAIAPAAATAQITTLAPFEKLPPYGNNTLPAGVKPRLVPKVNGLTVNVLEAGTPGRPLVLLLHGFPNLAYSWRKVMPAIADAGYYVVAPDCRGYGRTVGWDRSFDADPTPFLTLNMVRDQIALIYALGYRKAELIVGHDQGQLPATYAAIVRPDMFLRLTTVSGQGAAPRLSGILGQQAGRRRHEAHAAQHERLLSRVLLHERRRVSRQPEPDAVAADADCERSRGRECADAGVLRDATRSRHAGHDGRVHADEGVHRELQVVHSGRVRCLRSGVQRRRGDRGLAQLSSPPDRVCRKHRRAT